MGKGRGKTTYLTENMVKDLISFYIYRKEESIVFNNKTYYRVEATFTASFTNEIVKEQAKRGISNPYYILGIYLNNRGIENNILEYAEALMTHAYDYTIKYVKIEQSSIFTNIVDSGMFMSFLRFVQSKLLWDVNGFHVSDKAERSVERFQITNITNNKKLSYIFHLMEKRGLVCPNWQNIIEDRGIAFTKKGKQLTAKDLNSALNEAKETAESTIKRKTQQEYKEIERFVENL